MQKGKMIKALKEKGITSYQGKKLEHLKTFEIAKIFDMNGLDYSKIKIF